MLSKNINLNSLSVFSSVYRLGSMTLAAKELAMTQPGVTQHIKNLERSLNIQLFHRMGKKLVASKEAENLYNGTHSSLAEIESTLLFITEKERQFRGTVHIGVPIEFGNTIILPKLSKIRSQFPQIQFHITYGLPHELNSLILEGKLDFAFIDQYQINPSIKTSVVYQENLILCCSEEYYQLINKTRLDRKFFESLNYLAYQQGAPIIRNWFERAYNLKKMKLNIASYSFDVTGVATLVHSSMGVGVLPEHVFINLKKRGFKLHQFKSKSGTVNNPISIAYLDQRWHIPLNQFVIEILTSMINENSAH